MVGVTGTCLRKVLVLQRTYQLLTFELLILIERLSRGSIILILTEMPAFVVILIEMLVILILIEPLSLLRLAIIFILVVMLRLAAAIILILVVML